MAFALTNIIGKGKGGRGRGRGASSAAVGKGGPAGPQGRGGSGLVFSGAGGRGGAWAKPAALRQLFGGSAAGGRSRSPKVTGGVGGGGGSVDQAAATEAAKISAEVALKQKWAHMKISSDGTIGPEHVIACQDGWKAGRTLGPVSQYIQAHVCQDGQFRSYISHIRFTTPSVF